MPISNTVEWAKWVEANTDSYGSACVAVALKAMELLDNPKYAGDIDPHKLVGDADKALKAGITGFMSGCVAQMISVCHSRGEEFRKAWNKHCQIGNEGDKANEEGKGVLNPALLGIGT